MYFEWQKSKYSDERTDSAFIPRQTGVKEKER